MSGQPDVWLKNDWKYCSRCGCPNREDHLDAHDDPVLNIKAATFTCKDAAMCALLKEHHEQALARDKANDEAMQKAIEERKAKGKDAVERKERRR